MRAALDIAFQAIADGMREAFAEIFEINEFAYKCSKDQIEGIVAQITGLKSDDRVLKAIAGTFWNLLSIADFEAEKTAPASGDADESGTVSPPNNQTQVAPDQSGTRSFGLNYSIFLNLPETTDVEVYNAIFQSLRANLMKDS